MKSVKTVYIGADHGGFAAKEQLKPWLKEQGYAVVDKGNTALDPDDDYPQFARAVAEAVADTPGESRGILLCRTGEGMDIVANKVKGIRATVGWNAELAQKAREHNDANVLTLAADYQTAEEMQKIVEIFLTTAFPEPNGERHVRRVEQIKAIENKNSHDS